MNRVTFAKIRRLGSGHFGEVWLEEDLALGRLCASKYLNPLYLPSGSDPYSEAQAMMVAKHENVVEVFGADEVNGEPVIRMEYLSAGSVEGRYQGRPVPVAEAVRLIEEACRGVEHLHGCGLLHRDIKPANLLLSGADKVKVSDFGLSCYASATSGVPPWGYTAHLPPESIAMDRGIDSVRGDVYALGVTAYRILNGDAEFAHALESSGLTLAKGSENWLPHIHPKLRQVIAKAVSESPDRRYESAWKFRHALEKARPVVSWHANDPYDRFSWSGFHVERGVSWRAYVESRPKGIQRFHLEKALQGKSWRRLRTDSADFIDAQSLLEHANLVLTRVAVTGQ